MKTPLSKTVPADYFDLFNKITDPWVFAQDQWYKLPSDKLKVEFLKWYYQNYGCIEYSETGTHFKVTFWPLLRKPGIDLTLEDFSNINGNNIDEKRVITTPVTENPYELDGL